MEQAWGSSEKMCISKLKRATGLAMVGRDVVPHDMVHCFSVEKIARGG